MFRACETTDKNDALQKRLKLKNQSLRRLTQRLDDANQSLTEQVVDPLDVEKKTTKLTFRGCIALGCRKSMAVVSAQSFPLAGLVDVSRWTVARSEILIWAVNVARARSWHHIVYNRLAEVRSVQDDISIGERLASEEVEQSVVPAFANPSESFMPKQPMFPSQQESICKDLGLPGEKAARPDAWHVGSTFFCGDATNSSFWQRQKLQGLEVASSVVTNIEALNSLDYKRAFNTMWSL